MSDLIERMSNHDSNAEGRDIFDRGRVRVAVGWLWLTWQFGGGFDYDPHGSDPARLAIRAARIARESR